MVYSLERTLYSVVNAYIIKMMFIKAIFNKTSWQFNVVNVILRFILIK
jgi:hypothetical protein